MGAGFKKLSTLSDKPLNENGTQFLVKQLSILDPTQLSLISTEFPTTSSLNQITEEKEKEEDDDNNGNSEENVNQMKMEVSLGLES